ncbi:hypothetical protein BDZ97DRAFT_569682 [Flammula alnicola]|nr:hypothetical protein BDZ97DRAFT_569682 [Flammula alnicola]
MTQTPSWVPDSVELVPHPSARDKCIAKTQFRPGSPILSTYAFAAILLDSEKGRRCDACFRIASHKTPLKRCSGCGSYWYCDAQCQAFQWRTHHKRICKGYNSHLSSPGYQALLEHQKLDSILLSHTLAQMSLSPDPYSFEDSSPVSVLMSLLPYPDDSIAAPAICPITPSPSDQLVSRLYARFGNNNFAIHSHLTTIGHGVFPISSRLFNHSCVPNAAVKYTLSPAQSIKMEVVALRDILPGEEICLPYLDPALLESREQILEISYGFKCNCSSSLFLRSVGRLPELPTSPSEMSLLARQLREFVGLSFGTGSTLPDKPLETIPPSLYCVLRESYMGSLSETFSEASHEGQYDLAIESGMTLLSLYVLVYPINYPQIGMHLLELAKTAWNVVIASAELNGGQEESLKEQASIFLTLARQVLTIFGPEGDDGGPLQEIVILEGLLSDGS